MKNMPIMTQITGLSAVRKVSQKNPTTMSAVPAFGKMPYFPVRAISWPLTIEAIMRPRIIGSIRKPLSVGVAPCTSCR